MTKSIKRKPEEVKNAIGWKSGEGTETSLRLTPSARICYDRWL